MEDTSAVNELLQHASQLSDTSQDNIFVIPQNWISSLQNVDYTIENASSCDAEVTNVQGATSAENLQSQCQSSVKLDVQNLQCSTCEKTFKSLMSLNYHIKRMHSNLVPVNAEECKYLCGKCGKMYTSMVHLKEHDEAVHLKKLHKCKFCKSTFKWKTNLYAHQRTHNTGYRPRKLNINRKCKQCSLEFASNKLFDRHMHEIHGSTFKCKFCQKQFGLKHVYEQHRMTTHRNLVNKFECDVCKRRYASENILHNHMELEGHSPTVALEDKTTGVIKNVYKCKLCETDDTVYETNKAFRDHLQNAHRAKMQQIPNFNGTKKCRYCFKTFENWCLYREHVKTHSGKKERKCDHCDYKCFYPSDLRKHIATHTGETPYKCTFCGERFKSISSQRSHEHRHTKKYSHTCDICQKGFYKRHDFESHMHNHNQEWKFECNFCKKMYPTKQSLERHKKDVHSNSNTYSCVTCGDAFPTEELFKEHNKIHCNDIICVVCRKSFKNQEEIEDHKSLAHVKNCLERLKMDYVCTLCSVKCDSTESFALHCLHHLNTSPFHCVNCKLQLTERKWFTKHMEVKHQVELRMTSEEVQREVVAKIELEKMVAFRMVKDDTGSEMESARDKSLSKSMPKSSKTLAQKFLKKSTQKAAEPAQDINEFEQDNVEWSEETIGSESGLDPSMRDTTDLEDGGDELIEDTALSGPGSDQSDDTDSAAESSQESSKTTKKKV
ncbi:uncharacterized protein [Amphiura filiformis]|uniref:uncharacterized protein n=1 Tax=Amphiura filiformis TaxID=82378 RepID=UPI003B211567